MTRKEADMIAGALERMGRSMARGLPEVLINHLNKLLYEEGSEWEFEYSNKTGEVTAIENF